MHILQSRIPAVVMLGLFALLASLSMASKSTTFDEMAHLTGGYSYWLKSDYRLHPENGNLPQRWAAIPLLLRGDSFPDTDSKQWRQSDVWGVGHQLFHLQQNDLESMLWWSRLMIVAVGVGLGILVWAWTKRLFGPLGATIAVTAYGLSPTMLAHTRLVTSDVTAALFFVASIATIWMTLHHVSVKRIAISALVLGGLFVSKMSAVLMIPIAGVLVLVRLVFNRPMIVSFGKRRIVKSPLQQTGIITGVIAVHAIVAILVIWTFYGFRFQTFNEFEPGRDNMFGNHSIEELTDDGIIGRSVRLMHDGRVLPEPYLHGFAFAIAYSKSRAAFLNGEVRATGWRHFFPYAFAVKTPLAILALLFVAGIAAVAKITTNRDGEQVDRGVAMMRLQRALYRTAPLWVFLAIYWVVAIRTNLNIGHRHVLPTYPVMFVLLGALAYWFGSKHKAVVYLAAVAIGQLAFESFAIHPHYLAYFNQSIGGPKEGYRHLVDSSLDWGQDLPAFKKWLDDHRANEIRREPVYFSYFGTGSPGHYELDAIKLPTYFAWPGPRSIYQYTAGTYCISATMFQNVYTKPFGPWQPHYEEAYQSLKKQVDEFHKLQATDLDAFKTQMQNPKNAAKWTKVFSEFDGYRFGRLCAYLRLREPDEQVAYTILVFKLNSEDIDRAMNQPVTEWIAPTIDQLRL